MCEVCAILNRWCSTCFRNWKYSILVGQPLVQWSFMKQIIFMLVMWDFQKYMLIPYKHSKRHNPWHIWNYKNQHIFNLHSNIMKLSIITVHSALHLSDGLQIYNIWYIYTLILIYVILFWIYSWLLSLNLRHFTLISLNETDFFMTIWLHFFTEIKSGCFAAAPTSPS